MPSVGMRRSTRIFVPKSSVVKDGGDLGKVLRSGKRLLVTKQEQQQNEDVDVDEHYDATCYNTNGWKKVVIPDDVAMELLDDDVKEEEEEGIVNSVSVISVSVSVDDDEIRYKNVYDRKRRRSSRGDNFNFSSGGSLNSYFSTERLLKENMCGNFYVRKRRKTRSSTTTKVDVSEVGVDVELLRLRSTSTSNVPGVTLDVTVDFSPSSALWFTRFLASVLRYLRNPHTALPGLTAFMCCDLIVEVFSRNGVQFKPGFLLGSSLDNGTVSSGFCRVFGCHRFVPLFWLDFSAVPLSFRYLNSIVFIRSLYIPHVLVCFLTGLLSKPTGVTDKVGRPSCIPVVVALPHCNNRDFVNICVKKRKPKAVVAPSVLGVRRVLTRSAASRNIPMRRSSHCSKRVRSSSSLGSQGRLQRFNSNSQIAINHSVVDNNGSECLDIVEFEHGGCSSLDAPGADEIQTDLVSNVLCPNDKEVACAKVELGHESGSLCCSANVLVIESDRCYREEGAAVMLECSTSNVWLVVVKTQGLTKYIYQAHEVMKPTSTNRFTHAMIWTAENGWKLEFCNRNDWITFKEIHKECLSRNDALSAKTIPVPGVREVLNYDDDERVPFTRPDAYVTVHNNEVARALVKKTANYDHDPDDEEWLEKLNGGLCNGHDGVVEHLSAERFEEIIDMFEKAAYRSPGDVSDGTKMTSLCIDFGRGDVILAVYQYWLKKRKQKRASLLRVFEFHPPRKAQLAQENVLRKKRSFKKQASKNGRAKQRYNCEAMPVEQEELAVKRVQEALIKAKESLVSAVLKRKRAQTLMENADLSTYFAAMALRIAETIQQAESSDATTVYSLPGKLSAE
ncbi:hypothetical protein IFM89_014710 [Coptis chinensis]|uniref:Enhancer of polycomb-like protein n=1 Tax=Coptis chinensis TaxID=261450 RepID=A0A835LRM6_9MAGN|nr:hypothetical protein IFM89_014710 [Coptis chinensis]